MKRVTIILFILALIGGLVYYTPLSFALRVAGVSNQSIGWRQARGTVWDGQVTGLTIGSITAGHTELKLKPKDLMRGRLGFRTRWSAPFGRAAGDLHPVKNGIALNDTTIEVFLANAPFIDPRLRDLSATIRGQNLDISLAQDGCVEASGTILTDALTLAGLKYGRSWPELKGNLSCENKTLITSLSGTGDAGETFRFTARYSGSDRFTYNIEATDIDFEAQAALTSIGFTANANGLSYGSNRTAEDTR